MTHFLFADVCFLLCKANEKELQTLSKALKKYEKASGWAINFQKSEILFSKNADQLTR